MEYSKELHERVRENLHMFDYPRFDDGDIHGLLDEIERLQKLVDAKQNRCAELESRLDLYHGNMYDVVCAENDRLTAANKWVSVKVALPERDGEYLVVNANRTDKFVDILSFTTIGVYNNGNLEVEKNSFHHSESDGGWGYSNFKDNVTHWMPLPELPTPPTGGENE